MSDDIFDNFLERDGLYNKLAKKEDKIVQSVMQLYSAYVCYHGKKAIEDEFLKKLIWDIVRADPDIVAAIFRCSNYGRIDVNYEIDHYGGVLSKKICSRILEMLKAKKILNLRQ